MLQQIVSMLFKYLWDKLVTDSPVVDIGEQALRFPYGGLIILLIVQYHYVEHVLFKILMRKFFDKLGVTA